jgi:hypothetical protein
MSDVLIPDSLAGKMVQTRIDKLLDQAVTKAAGGDFKGAVRKLGEASHTVQDYRGHALATLPGHGLSEVKYQTPEKVALATQETKKLLQRFETKLSKNVGKRYAAIIKRVKKAGENEE